MTSRVWWVTFGILIMAVCYHAPWVAHATAGFTMHGFDLAEWTSLHPAVRSSSPELLTSLLLRLPLWVVVSGLALAANGFDDARLRWIMRAVALGLALRFMPPKEFFTTAGDDPNYRQMLLLTGLSMVAVIASLGIGRLPERAQAILFVVVVLGGALAGWWGFSRAGELFDNFEIAVSHGFGIYGYTVAAFLSALAAFVRPVPPAARSNTVPGML